jgi:hypothetical protein
MLILSRNKNRGLIVGLLIVGLLVLFVAWVVNVHYRPIPVSSDIVIERMVVKQDLSRVPKSIERVCLVRASFSGQDEWVVETEYMADLDRRILTKEPSCLDRQVHPGRVTLIYYGKIERSVLDNGGHMDLSPAREKAMKYLKAGYTVAASVLVECNSPTTIWVIGRRHDEPEIIDHIQLSTLECRNYTK